MPSPWNWDSWKDITGIRHGLFPESDANLPERMSRRDLDDVLSYFKAYNAMPSETAKLRFASGKGDAKAPGRTIWNAYVRKNYNKWGINGLVVQALNKANAHPVKQMLGENNLDVWPSSDQLLPQALNEIGLALFGTDAINLETENIHGFLRAPTLHIAQRAWSTLNKKFNCDHDKLQEYEKAAQSSFECTCINISMLSFSRRAVYTIFQLHAKTNRPKPNSSAPSSQYQNGRNLPTYSRQKTFGTVSRTCWMRSPIWSITWEGPSSGQMERVAVRLFNHAWPFDVTVFGL
jgi:hypothetical protein